LLIHGSRWQQKLPQFVAALLKDANHFEILGIAEREMGATIVDRVRLLRDLRRAMDGEGVVRPIHIFGTDDPLSILLYAAAGADLFDGLGWSTDFIDAQHLSRQDFSHAVLSPLWRAFCERRAPQSPAEKAQAGLVMEWNIEQLDGLLASVRQAILHDHEAVFPELCARSHLEVAGLVKELSHGW